MSAETKMALAEAIRAHISDEIDDPDLMITSYAVITAAMNPSYFGTGAGRYDITTPDAALFHDTLGLLGWATDFKLHPEEG